ncbi:MAG: multiheme c-type cytochrome, partial [bacterium]|nr:multiheme c-type cytochrome [bacterium]
MRGEKLTLLMAVAGILLAGWLLVGCEGEPGPAGPPGPGLSGEALYAGDDANTCGHCHGELTESWGGTGHSGAWAALGADTTNVYCQQCHTTGFDDVYDHNGNRLSSGINNGGYDDTRDPKLRNVQCEACHGPMGVNPAAHTPMLAANFSGESCDKCHEQNAEWATSAHGTVFDRMTREEFADDWGGSCSACHISEGFIAVNDPDQANLTFNGETANMIGCATCHDAHAEDNAAQLRTLDDATSPYGGEEFPDGYAITGLGKGQICAQCHHARRSRSRILQQIDEGDERPGPHASPQADMVSGRGCWETPGTYERENPHVGMLENMCVDCHMYAIPRDQTGGPVFGHSFAPDI